MLHLCSESVSKLLALIPDSKGTLAYLEVIKCVIDSYLDKKLQPALRVEKAWYSLRYWREWILLKPEYTLIDNFITTNAYVCTELNAHALISFLLTARDTLPPGTFMPWLLGSQSCEKIFRTARSLSSTFSTVINFGMLGLSRRLNRIHIQLCLEAESSMITYPRNDPHKKKSGYDQPNVCCVQSITNETIECAIKNALAKDS